MDSCFTISTASAVPLSRPEAAISSRTRTGAASRGAAQDILDAAVDEAIGHAIPADQKAVARFESHGAGLGFNLLRVCTEDFLQDISLGMVFRLTLVDLAVSEKPADIGEIHPAWT